ncbi:MAG: hypothetical protein HKN19_18335 [Halioglobus sp.]|nr:hypothetical protein [Halioglobus sp.]
MKKSFQRIASRVGVSDWETALLVLVATAGWAYFAYMYIYESGLGAGVPRYAGY